MSTVYDSFAPWRDDGTWAKMSKALATHADLAPAGTVAYASTSLEQLLERKP